MNTAVKFLILYLIPIITFASSVGVYVHAHGKPPENTFVSIGFAFVVSAFITSCVLAFNVISQYLSTEVSILGIGFALLALILELVVVGLYLVIFYGFLNP
jgi:hypothetical protein